MKTPCRRICKLNDKQMCIGCGRSWEQIREWYFYSEDKKLEIIEQLKDFKSSIKNKFEN